MIQTKKDQMIRTLICMLLLVPLGGMAQPLPETEPPEPVAPLSLEQLAEAADLVALVQVADTDYQFTREFPSGGSAFLRVLIPYKVSRPLEDLLEVYEEGLHEYECYFPTVDVGQVGRRYLVFLTFSRDVKEQYNGLAQGCALEALVTRDNRYALKYPLEGMALSEDYTSSARAMVFADENALISDEDISPDRRNRLLEGGWLIREEASPEEPDDPFSPAPSESEVQYRFTHGIELSEARRLLGPDALTLDRALK
jgi:hypothetical protein